MMDSFQYISSANYFWHSMAMTTACSIFLGSFLYNGDHRTLAKGILTLLPYIALLITTTVLRINGLPEINNHVQVYAGLCTIVSLTIFYMLGLFLGVTITKLAHKK